MVVSELIVEESGQSVAGSVEIRFYGALGHGGDGRYAGYGELLEIEEPYDGPLGRRESIYGRLDRVVAYPDLAVDAGVGNVKVVDRLRWGEAAEVGQIFPVGDAEEPCLEAGHAFEGADGQIGFEEGLLRQVVGEHGIASGEAY